ncbi:unnamed protein product [Calypogeia fissa]
MASKTVVALLVCSVLFGAVVQAQDFDFFYFVQQWPGSYCDTRSGCCFPLTGAPKAVFGIHGLWPNYNDGSYPQSCGSESYDPQDVTDLLAEMDDDWGSLACPSSDSENFWNHEWSKHGTCSGMNEHDYFQAALNLYTTYDITGALANAGIKPDGRQYKVEDIQNAISNALDGHLPGIECNKDDKSSKQLYQVYICVSTDGSTLIDCPVFPSNECKGLVEFPVFDASSYSGSSQRHSSDSSEHSHSSYNEEARSDL